MRMVELLRTEKIMSIQKLADTFQVSIVTIRRDLEQLAGEGLIKRIHGGAAIVEQTESSVDKILFSGRIATQREEKEQIARRALSLVNEGDTIFLDTGTTVAMLARELQEVKNITVVTNSLAVMNLLCDSEIPVYGLGGLMRGRESAFSGSVTISMLQNFYFDRAFLGVGGISLEAGVTDYFFETTQLRRAVLERSREAVLLADSQKFGKNTPAVVFPLDSVDYMVTDKKPDEIYVSALKEAGVQLLYPV